MTGGFRAFWLLINIYHIIRLFLLNATLFPFSLSEISEILASPSICTKIRTWRFHRTEEISASLHITHISLAISANLGRDIDHNSTRLVFAHPLPEPLENEIKKSTSKQNFGSAFVPGYLGFPQYCVSTCVRFGCTLVISTLTVWIPNQKKKMSIR